MFSDYIRLTFLFLFYLDYIQSCIISNDAVMITVNYVTVNVLFSPHKV